MDHQIKKTLEELHDELKRIGPGSEQLQRLQEKTARALEAGEHLPLVEEIRNNTQSFEAQHPQLTALLNNAMNALSGLGI